MLEKRLLLRLHLPRKVVKRAALRLERGGAVGLGSARCRVDLCAKRADGISERAHDPCCLCLRRRNIRGKLPDSSRRRRVCRSRIGQSSRRLRHTHCRRVKSCPRRQGGLRGFHQRSSSADGSIAVLLSPGSRSGDCCSNCAR